MYIEEEINPRLKNQKDYLPFQRKRVAIENLIDEGCTVEEVLSLLDFNEDYTREVYQQTMKRLGLRKAAEREEYLARKRAKEGTRKTFRNF